MNVGALAPCVTLTSADVTETVPASLSPLVREHIPYGAPVVPEPPFITRWKNQYAAREKWIREQTENRFWWDTPGGFPYNPEFEFGGFGFGYGGYGGFPADRSQDRTHAPLPYLTETEWRVHLAMARDLVQRNGLALGFRDHVRGFIGKMSVTFVLRGQSPGATPSGPTDADGDGQPDVHPLVKQVLDVWDEFCRLNSWGRGLINRERECVNRLIVEGESIQRFFKGGYDTKGIPRVRHVEPEFLRTPPGGSTNGPEGWGPENDIDDAETIHRYWICNPDDTTDGQHVDADRIVHAKANVDGVIKRGLSDFFPVAGLLRKVLEIRENMAHTQRLLSAIAWWEQFPTATEEQVRRMIEPLRDYQANRLTTSTSGARAGSVDVQHVDAGSIIRTEAGRQVVPPPAATNTPNFVQSDEMILRGVSFRWGMPDFFAGQGAASFAGLLVKGSPLVTLTEERQDVVKEFTAEVARRVIRLAEESGRLPRGTCERVEPVVTAPPVEIADEEKQARTDIALFQQGLRSPFAIMRGNKEDPKQVMADIAAHAKQRAQMGGQPPPGAPPPPPPGPNSTPPGSAGGDGSSPNNPDAGKDSLAGLFGESKDASGHQHKDKGPGGGQFTAGSSGDKADNEPEKSASEQWQERADAREDRRQAATTARKHHDNDDAKPTPLGKVNSYELTNLPDDEHEKLLEKDLDAYDTHHATTRKHLVEAGATEKELGEFDRRVEKYRADIVKGQEKTKKARLKWQKAKTKSDEFADNRGELEKAEPEEPDYEEEPDEPDDEDEPEEPQEPEYKNPNGVSEEPDRNDYEDGEEGERAYEIDKEDWDAHIEWTDEHADWESELEAVQDRNKKAHADYREELAAVQSRNQKAQAHWEKSHDDWEAKLSKFDDRKSDLEEAEYEAENAYDRVASEYETDFMESIDHIGEHVGDVEDAVHARLDEEDLDDPQPDEEESDHPAKTESLLREHGEPPFPGAVLTGNPPRWHVPDSSTDATHPHDEHAQADAAHASVPAKLKAQFEAAKGALAEKLKQTKGGRVVLAMGTGGLWLFHAIEHRLLFVMKKSQELAVEAARQRGLPEEKLPALQRALYIADFLGGYATGAAGLAAFGPLGAKVGSLLPSASVLYLAYSTSRDPAATWKAARTVLARTFQKTPPKAESVNAEPDFQLTPELAAKLAERIQAAGDDDWYVALFAAAMTETDGNADEAMKRADAVIAETPNPPTGE